MVLKRIRFVLFFLILSGFYSFKPQVSADTFFGEVPTGLLELSDYKEPVFLFVPPNYKPDRSYPMIVALPGEGESPEKHIQLWTGLAKRNSFFILVPTNIWPRDTPETVDQWILDIKKDVAERYQIAQRHTFLVGSGDGAHYGAYLGVRYPDQFAAVALLGGSWVGKFETLIRPQTNPRKQVPFFVALKENSELIEPTKKFALQLEAKGYPVYLKEVKDEKDFWSDPFKKELVEWLKEKSQDWSQHAELSKRSLKEKMNIAIEDFFHT